MPISLGTKPQLLPVTYGALGDQPVTPLWTQPLPVWWPSPVQGKAVKPGDVDIFCEQEERQEEEGNQKERGGDPWRGSDAKDAGGAVFWDFQCGAKKTEHPFPTSRA